MSPANFAIALSSQIIKDSLMAPFTVTYENTKNYL